MLRKDDEVWHQKYYIVSLWTAATHNIWIPGTNRYPSGNQRHGHR
jgi:hypothetical protein